MQKLRLTYPQQNILLLEKVNKNLPINSIVGTIEINEKFDEKICNDAINHVIKNNDAMRINIDTVCDQTYQFVKDFEYKSFEVINLSLYSESKIKEYINDCALLPLFLGKNGLFEFKIISYGNGKGSIFMKIHHIICDAWSCSNIGTQLMEYIISKLNGNEIIDENKPSYVEFVQKEIEYENSEKYKKDEEFWKNYLENVKETVSLSNFSNNLFDTKAKRYNVKIDEKFNNQINEYCKENKVSPFALFMGALATYIYRTKEENDFVIGTPLLNRSNFKEKQMLGMFIATVPMRMKIKEKITFIDLVREISRNNLELFRHQKYPYAKLLENVHNNSNVKSNLYSIILSYQNARADMVNNEVYNTTWSFIEHISDELQIHVMDMDNTGVLNINYDYKTSLFSDIEIKYLHERITSIIQDAIENVDVDVENIRIMSKFEENKILKEFNNTVTDYPKNKTLIEIFEEQAKSNPEKIALEFEGKILTYHELNEKANKLAYFIKTKYGVKENDIIGIIQDKSLELVISILACLKCGAAYLPIEKNYPKDRIEYMISNSNCNLILSDENKNDKNITIDYINVKEVLEKNESYEKVIVSKEKYTSDSTVYIMYTSGTTGKPKGVCVTNKNVMRLVKNTNYINFKENDVIIQTGATVFDASTFEIWGALLNGLKLYLIKKENLLNPKYLEKSIKENNITIMWLTAPLFNQMVDYNVDMFKTLRVLLVGGDVLSVKHINKVIRNCPDVEVINGYGPTENTTFSMCYKIKKEFTNSIPIGMPISNSFGYIVDSKMRLLPMYVKGELLVGGDGVAKGYLNDEKRSNESFVSDPFNLDKIAYKTGDIAYFEETGDIRFFGRSDNQFKIRGFRIELDEIKHAILELNYIKDVYVTVLKNKTIDNIKESEDKIYAYYVCDEIKENENIESDLKNKLPNYMIPNFFIKVNEIPLNQNGKVDKITLINSNKIIEESNKINKPKNEVQEIIHNVIKNVLNIDADTKLSLFSYGMDSLSAIKLAIELSNKFNVEISTKDVFSNNTIELLEKLVLNNKNENIDNNLIYEIKNFSLTDAQIGIFIECMKNPELLSYNIPFELELNKNYEISYVKECLEKLIKSNKVFFTKIISKDNNIYQIIDEHDIDIKVKENLTKQEYEKYKENFVKKFDLLNDKLFRVEIVKVEEKIHILFDIHHIIFDGTSIIVLINELEKILDGESITIKESVLLKKSIKEKNNKNTKSYLQAKNYIMNKFNKNLEYCNIPYDFNVTKNNERKCCFEEFVLNKKDKIYLENFAKENNITLNNLFLGIFGIMLSKYSGSNNILLGIGSNDRKTKEELDSIGMFVKTLLVNLAIDYENNINEYFACIQKEVITTLNYDEFSYIDFMNEYSKQNKNEQNILKTMFMYQNIAISKNKFEKIKLTEIDNNVAKFDFVCQVIPSENDIKVKLEYDNSLYLKSTIEKFGKSYIYVLSKLKEYIESNISLSKIDIVLKEEKELLLNKFNDTTTNYSKELSISQVFEKQVEMFKDTTALILGENKLSYNELNKEANKLARFLRNDLKVSKNQVISIIADKSFEMVVGILAIIKAGACYLPIDYSLPDSRINYMIKNSSSKIIINCTDKNLDFVENDFNNDIEKISIIDIKNLNLDLYSSENLENINVQEDLSYVMYTSGSTGNPKGCMNTHKGIIKLVKNINYLDIDKVDNVFLAGNLVFDASLHEMWICLLNGKTGVIIKKDEVLTPIKYKLYFEKYENILAIFTTQLFHQYANSIPELFKKAKYVICGGDVLLYQYVEKVKKVCQNTEIINIYGPAECSAAATTFNVNEMENTNNKAIPIGKPISNTRCYVLDNTLNLCPINVQGQLYIGGDGVGKGYINNQELTEKVFINNNIDNYSEKLYKTGDIVKWSEDGVLEFLGRKDRQVKIRGYRVEISEIENVALEYRKIKEVKVVLKNEEENKKLIMYYTSDIEVNIENLKKYILTKLPSFMLPDYYIKLDKMPLTLNGKIDVRNLPKVNDLEFLNTKKVDDDFSEVRNDIDIKLEKILCKILKLERISIKTNLLDIGLDSINITKFCIEAMNQKLNITYADVFEYPTIEKLSDLILHHSKKEYNYNIEEYDYNDINKLLHSNIKYTNLEVKDVLITGVNGFLGAHVLAEFLDNYTGYAYCVVRGKAQNSGYERLKSILNYYFKDKYNDIIDKRVKIIDVEITSKKFEEIINETVDNTNINKIINCAAKVKHFGRFKDFYKLNVESVKKLIKISLKNNIKLIHISTLSVSGNGIEGGITTQKLNKNIQFTEKDLYVGQKINNVYSYSKFLAEREILESIINNNLNATIIRVGNLMGRYSDGKFQKNKHENAFIERIKFLADKKIITKDLMENSYIELSPIDLTAKSILKISDFEKCEYIYHVYNYNHYKIKDLLEYLKNQKNIYIKVLSDEEFYDKLDYEIKNNNKISSTIITDLNSDKKLDYSSSIKISYDITEEMYKKIDFKWNVIDYTYLDKFFSELNI